MSTRFHNNVRYREENKIQGNTPRMYAQVNDTQIDKFSLSLFLKQSDHKNNNPPPKKKQQQQQKNNNKKQQQQQQKTTTKQQQQQQTKQQQQQQQKTSNQDVTIVLSPILDIIRILNSCDVRIENSVTRAYVLGKPRDAETEFSICTEQPLWILA